MFYKSIKKEKKLFYKKRNYYLFINLILVFILPLSIFVFSKNLNSEDSIVKTKLKSYLMSSNYIEFSIEGELENLEKIIKIPPAKLEKITIYIDRLNNLTYILNDQVILMVINGENNSISVNTEELNKFAEIPDNYRENTLYQKISTGKYLSLKNINNYKKEFYDMSFKNNSIYIQTNLSTILSYSNLGILKDIIENITGSNFYYDKESLLTLEVKDKELLVDLAPLKFEGVILKGKFIDKKLGINAQTTSKEELELFNTEQAILLVDDYINKLTKATIDLAYFENKPLTYYTLIKAYQEVEKNPLLLYQSTTESIKVSYLNSCKVIFLENESIQHKNC